LDIITVAHSVYSIIGDSQIFGVLWKIFVDIGYISSAGILGTWRSASLCTAVQRFGRINGTWLCPMMFLNNHSSAVHYYVLPAPICWIFCCRYFFSVNVLWKQLHSLWSLVTLVIVDLILMLSLNCILTVWVLIVMWLWSWSVLMIVWKGWPKFRRT